LTQTPGLLSSNIEIAVISALWYYKTRVMDKINTNINGNTSVKLITLYVNGGENGLPHRMELLDKCKQHIECL